MMFKLISGVTCILTLSAAVIAQQTANPCKDQATYENKNQVEPQRLYLSTLSGKVIVETGEFRGEPREIGVVSGACVYLFSERGHRLVASVVADDNGHFAFDHVSRGQYRLIVRAQSLCVANARVEIVRKSSARRGRRIVVHMRPSGYDACSYADYK